MSLRLQKQNVDVCHPSIGIEVDQSRMSSSHLIAAPTDPVINLHYCAAPLTNATVAPAPRPGSDLAALSGSKSPKGVQLRFLQIVHPEKQTAQGTGFGHVP